MQTEGKEHYLIYSDIIKGSAVVVSQNIGDQIMLTAIFVTQLFIVFILIAIGVAIDSIRKGIESFVLEMQKTGESMAAKTKEEQEDE